MILLDIDGVLVSANSWEKPMFMDDGFPVFKVASVNALQRIILTTNASLLLTTSHKTNYTDQQWKDMFQLRGLYAETISCLTTDSLEISRKDEILAWYENSKRMKHL